VTLKKQTDVQTDAMKVGDLVVATDSHSRPSRYIGTGIILQHNSTADREHRWTVLIDGAIYAFSSDELTLKGVQ